MTENEKAGRVLKKWLEHLLEKKTTKHQVVETHGGERESCGRWDDSLSSSKGSAFP